MQKLAVGVALLIVAATIVYFLMPHYQLSTAPDGTITRMETRSGRVEVLVSSANGDKWTKLPRQSALDGVFDAVLHPAK